MANDNRIQLYVSDEVKKSIEAYAKYHDVSVSKAGAELLMQGAMNWSPSDDTQRYKNQPVNANTAEMSNTECVTTCNTNHSNQQSRHFQTRIICNQPAIIG